MIILLIALLAAAAPPASAQTQEKAQILVMNDRGEAVVMRFAYAFRQYTWQLMQQEIPPDEDLTYRFPVNLPGCEKLHEWGIADGILTISNASGTLCSKRVSLCDATAAVMHVQLRQCTWSAGETATPSSSSGNLIGP